METEEKIRKIIEFMNIPAFNQIMSAKLMELEIALAQQIAYFKELKSHFQEMVEQDWRIVEEKRESPAEPSYYFELMRTRLDQPVLSYKWTILNIQPPEASGVYEEMLNELAPILGNYHSSASEIECREFYCHSAKRYVIVYFTKYSDSYVFGVIRGGDRRLEKENSLRPPAMIKINMDFRRIKKEDCYGELLHYLDMYPELRDRLLTYFYIIEKPVVDMGYWGEGVASV